MLEPLVAAAYEYAFPLHTIARTRYRAAQDPHNPDRQAPNTLRHIRSLSDHRSRWITAPNNDTLYTNAWLDLDVGPLRLRVDAQPAGRYWSVALMDAFTNHFAVLGQRLDGTGPAEVTLVGPRHHRLDLPGRVIRTPGRDAWLFARCHVQGPEDLPEAHAMQDRMRLAPTAGTPASRVVPGEPTDAPSFLAVVNEALGRNPPPAAETPLLERWARVGLRPGATDAWQALDGAARQAWTNHIGAAFEQVRQYGRQGRREFQGWIASAADIGNFGNHYALRASVALGGLGALEPAEAMYFVRYADDERQPLDGRHRYRLRVPPGGIPTDSFWSFTMYEPTADGQRFFVDNPIGRYAIGNRTPGLVVKPDGSLELVLQQAPPDDPRECANWLPAPGGPFQVALRCYLPQPALREGRTMMPNLARCEPPTRR